MIVPSPSPRVPLPVLALGCALFRCTSPAATTDESGRPQPVRNPEAADADAGPADAARCAGLIAGVRGGPVAPGLESYHAALPRILLETRVAPVLYLRRPSETGRESALTLRRSLKRSLAPRPGLRRLVHKLRNDKPLLREVVLSDGCLFAETPALARALVAELRLADLFDEDEILIQEGDGWRRLRREGEDYVDEEGRREALLLGDRLALAGNEPDEPVHLDLSAVRSATGARRVVPAAVEDDRAAVRLVWPDGTAVAALLSLQDGATAVTCIDAPAERVARLAKEADGYWRWIDDLTGTAGRMVVERPGFDEPRDEPDGVQEDGNLRRAWKDAYFRGERTFFYCDEKYRVYDRRGNPVPPQVCIDFVFDTIERAAGTWYAPRGERPRRTEGYLDFEALTGLLRRQTPAVLAFAADEDTPLSRYDVPAGDRVPFRKRDAFASAVASQAEHIREGDVLVIHGLRDEDLEDHYHTALVLETDPVTGMPTLLADNAGRPRIRTLAAVMASAPRRTIKHRLRLDLSWLMEQRNREEPGIDGAGGFPSTSPR